MQFRRQLSFDAEITQMPPDCDAVRLDAMFLTPVDHRLIKGQAHFRDPTSFMGVLNRNGHNAP
jgi:hypothetical protein